MSKEKMQDIGFFEKYLTLWVIICMVIGVLIGKFLPGIPTFLNQFEYAKVSIPMAILIWIMIYPMMMKVDFQSIKNVGKNPKGLFVTWVTNWLIMNGKTDEQNTTFNLQNMNGAEQPDHSVRSLSDMNGVSTDDSQQYSINNMCGITN